MKNNRITVVAFVLLCVGLLLWPACDSSDTDNGGSTDFEAKETFSYTFSARQFNALHLDGISGYVSITGTVAGTAIQISGEKIVASSSIDDATQHLDDLEIVIDESGVTLKVKTEQPDDPRGRNYIVNYTITIPASKDLKVSNVNGNVELGQLAGKIEVDLVNGSVQCMGSSAPARDVRLSTVNGSIDYGIPVSASARLLATVVNGHISLSNLDISNAQITPTQVSLVLGGGGVNVQLSTVNGDVFACGLM